ncbi:Peroxisomal membrane protein pex16 [Chytridiales sp. JEL 0842]|nr:Peroxisomal membrane protein pex16 [Chytridiales sp. JEL 0842]
MPPSTTTASSQSAYESLVLKNGPLIATIESWLKTITYILPGRFKHSDIASEGLFAFVNVLSMYHDWILHNSPAVKKQVEVPSLINRYNSSWLKKSNVYLRVAYALSVIRSTEVLTEMVAKELGGKKWRWRIISSVEMAKFICRFLIFRISKQRMVMHSQIIERDYDMAQLRPDITNDTNSTQWQGKRTKKSLVTIDTLDSDGSKNMFKGAPKFLVTKAVNESVPPEDNVSKLSGVALVGEVIHLVRPLVYVMMLHKYGKKSWTPWAASLSLDIVGILASMKAASTQLEKEESERRLSDMSYYLLREPFYSMFTKPRLDKFIESASKKPILSLASGLLADYIPLWETYHFIVNP